MDIKRLVLIAIGVITISLFYFPVTFTAFPVTNTKNLLAFLGLIVAIVTVILHRRVNVFDRNVFVIGVLAVLVSMAGYFSVAYNETPDYAYATYIITFLIWFFSAYFSVFILKIIHGKVTVDIVCNYLILLCVLQCVSVLMIDNIPSMRIWAISTFTELSSVDKIDRLYGLGPALDVGGSRFAVVLLIIGYMLTLDKVKQNVRSIYMYIVAFLLIFVIGSMVGRTTSVGGGIALLYLLWKNRVVILSSSSRKIFLLFLFVLFVGMSVIEYLYNNNMLFRDNLRFAFEGFFNYFEQGEWTTTSTERWETMFIWPESLKTWLIGDGYFDGPSDTDPYYVGPFNPGFYKWTDIGYHRFIYYFGLIGLVLFIIYLCKVTVTCMTCYKSYAGMFGLFLLFNFVLWFKVSTDIFLVYALFLCIPKESNDKNNEAVMVDNENSI